MTQSRSSRSTEHSCSTTVRQVAPTQHRTRNHSTGGCSLVAAVDQSMHPTIYPPTCIHCTTPPRPHQQAPLLTPEPSSSERPHCQARTQRTSDSCWAGHAGDCSRRSFTKGIPRLRARSSIFLKRDFTHLTFLKGYCEISLRLHTVKCV